MTDHNPWLPGADNANLSPEGQARRDAMRSELTSAVRQRRRRRTAGQWAAGAAVPLALAWFAWGSGADSGSSNPSETPAVSTPQRPEVQMAHADFAIVETPRDLRQRWASPTKPQLVVRVSDADLPALLRAAGTGLLKVGGGNLLLPPPQSVEKRAE